MHRPICENSSVSVNESQQCLCVCALQAIRVHTNAQEWVHCEKERKKDRRQGKKRVSTALQLDEVRQRKSILTSSKYNPEPEPFTWLCHLVCKRKALLCGLS